MDIGPKTEKIYADVVRNCKTIVWNGPQGVFEIPPFHQGSQAVLEALVESTKSGATSIVGGGETATFAS